MAHFCATLSFDRTYVAPSFSSLGDGESTYLSTLLSTARPDALLPSTLLAPKGLMQCEDGTGAARTLCKKSILGNVLLGKQIHPDRCKR